MSTLYEKGIGLIKCINDSFMFVSFLLQGKHNHFERVSKHKTSYFLLFFLLLSYYRCYKNTKLLEALRQQMP